MLIVSSRVVLGRVIASLAAFVGCGGGALAQVTRVFQIDGDQSEALFGSVEYVGDLDGDGFDEFVCGAPGSDQDLDGDGVIGDDEQFVGFARLYSGRTATVLGEWAGEAGNEMFGLEIAGIGDVNGDGVVDFAVGAPSVKTTLQRAYVRVFSGRHFRDPLAPELLGEIVDDQDRDFTPGPDGWQGDFGAVIAAAGDVDGDGFDDVLVAGGGNYHWVVLYSGHDLAPLATWDVHPSGSRTGAQTTAIASFRRDVTGDGKIDLVLGDCAWSDGRTSECGSVWIYSGITATVTRQYKGRAHHDWFGYAIAVIGDVTGDQQAKPELVITAPGTFDNTYGTHENGNYVMTYRGEDLGRPPIELNGSVLGVGPEAFFGSSLAAGDWQAGTNGGAAIPELFVAARHHDVFRGRIGCFAFDLGTKRWVEQWRLDGKSENDKVGRLSARGRITAAIDAPSVPDAEDDLLVGTGHVDVLDTGDERGRVWCLSHATGVSAEWSLDGSGWAGDGGASVPMIEVDAAPVLGTTVTVKITEPSAPAGFGALLIGLGTDPSPLLPHLLVSDFVVLLFLLDGGTASFMLEVSRDPTSFAVEQRYFAQALVAVDGVAGGVAYSARIDATLGSGGW
ncbi:MAG: hypothetical protein EXS13_10180 [Planctomycetes bacterium]|nr:hypothetical protein [Planctomycetota bacterium]